MRNYIMKNPNINTDAVEVYSDNFISILWNNSKTFNVYFIIEDKFRNVDTFTVNDVKDLEEAKAHAKEHAGEVNELLA